MTDDPQDSQFPDTDSTWAGDDLPPEALGSYVDLEAGAGAMTKSEDWVRANHRPEEHDGRAPTRTYFDARDVNGAYPSWQKHRDPEEKRSWQTMAHWQDGSQSDISRGGQNWWADKQRWLDTFGEILGATEYHEAETKRVLRELSREDIDADELAADREPPRMTTYQSARIPAEGVIIGIISLYIDADINDFANRTLERDGVRDLLDDLEMDVADYENVRSLLRQHDSDILFPGT